MGFVIQTVANYAPWIYALCGLVALYHIYKIWLVRSERQQAVFSLEREKAIHDTYNIFAVAMILLLAMGFTYFVSNTLADAVEPLVSNARDPNPPLPFVPTPTNTPLALIATNTPFPTVEPPGGAEVGAAETAEAESIATAEVETETAPTPEPIPTPAPVVQAPACTDSRAVLLRPGNNENVSGVINVIGTATHENFQYYKIEYAPGADAGDGFAYVGGGNSTITNGVLTSVDTRALNNGTWTLRLTVVDQTGNWPSPCQVTITIQN
jgi:hypothetical protein